jgi:hypothetical protein
MQRANNRWITGSSIRNFMFCDPICDYLELKNKKQNFSLSPFFKNKLLQEGQLYEEKIVAFLKTKYNVKHIANTWEDLYDIEKYNETLKCIEEKVEIIYQGVLIDFEKQIGGLCDLLIRSDIFNKIVEENEGVHFNNDKTLHYILIDVKNSKLNLFKDGVHLQNSRNYAYYKGQVFIYNEALKKMQKYDNNYAYILGKNWEFSKNGEKIFGSNPFQRMAKIDFENDDKHIIQKVNDAIFWLRNVRQNYESWSLFPPSVNELRPNLKVVHDKWQDQKLEIAKKQEDVTMLYYCGDTKRKLADALGITSFKKVSTSSLHIKSEKIATSIHRSIELSKSQSFQILPKTLNDLHVCQLKQEEMELYVDYETFYVENNTHCTNNQKGKTIVYFIGCGFVENNIWNFKSFILNDIKNETQIFEDFLKEINSLQKKFKIYSWGPTEKNLYEKYIGDESLFTEDKYIDLLKIFRNNSITLKNVYSYSLKHIAKAMYENKCISSIWPKNNNIQNGLDAMYEGFQLYQDCPLEIRCQKMERVKIYNEVDCKVMWEIVCYLRQHHM